LPRHERSSAQGLGSAPVKGLRRRIARNEEGTKGLPTLGELRLGSTSRWVHDGAPCSSVLDDNYRLRCYSSSQGAGAEASGNSSGAPRPVGGA
jgi:hypothetical protein